MKKNSDYHTAFEIHLLDNGCSPCDYQSNPLGVRCDLFEVIWIKKGGGFFMVDLEKFIICDNSLYRLFPGQLHLFAPKGELTGYRIAFSKAFLYDDIGKANDSSILISTGLDQCMPVSRVNDKYEKEIEKLLETILWEYHNDFQFKSEIIRGLLKITVAYFLQQFETEELNSISRNSHIIFREFLCLVEKKFRTLKLVSAYARELSVTPNYLSEVIKMTSGNSASYYIHKRIVIEAKRLMATSQLSLKEIGFQIGFEDSSQFSKFFKLKTGVTFSAFRSRISAVAK